MQSRGAVQFETDFGHNADQLLACQKTNSNGWGTDFGSFSMHGKCIGVKLVILYVMTVINQLAD